jgi:hypothetical protein
MTPKKVSQNVDITSYFRVIYDLNFLYTNYYYKTYIKIMRHYFGDISLGNRMVQLHLKYNNK